MPNQSKSSLTPDQKAALEIARYLVESGVPIFLADPATKPDGSWNPDGGTSGCGYWVPDEWQRTVADPAVIDDWQPGMAVCALMGHTVDLFDVDPRSGGTESLAKMRDEGWVPQSYGTQLTPSGGTHDFIAALSVRSRDKALPGIDVKSGDAEGEGRGFAFLAPTAKRSKSTGDIAQYNWASPPDLDTLILIGGDDSGRALAEHINSLRVADDYDGPAYDGDDYDSLTPALQQWADDYVTGVVAWWTERWAEALDWDEGDVDDKSRGWEALTRDFAWTVALLAAHPWSGVDAAAAREIYTETLPDAVAGDETCKGKFNGRLLAKAAKSPAALKPPPWDGLTPIGDDGAAVTRVRPTFEVTSGSDALNELRQQVGRPGTPLAGIFRKGSFLHHTPRVGEDGYIEPESGDDGPAQVRRLHAANLDVMIDFEYRVFKTVQRANVPVAVSALFPERISRKAASADAAAFPHVRTLLGVTHTPMVRSDGSILNEPGYDETTKILYLPEPGLTIGEIGNLKKAKRLIDEMLEGFPWVSEHDKVNYLAGLLTPLLRDMVKPPYKLMAIGAPQPGSGKSLLARLMRILHGGVMRSEFPRSNEELSKQITAILDTTSAPVVQFDNVTGTLKSSVFDGLLSSADWSDRKLGGNEQVVRRNDRFWVITGNNVAIGGDLARRTLWVTIDAQMEHPETRTDFAHTDLAGWVEQRRGDLLAALLTLIKCWVDAGRPVDDLTTTDDFGLWVQTTGGILSHAGFAGVVGHQDSVRQADGSEDEEWGDFLAGIHEWAGERKWVVKDLVMAIETRDIEPESVPDEVMDKISRHSVGATRSVGRWFLHRQDRWAKGFAVHQVPSTSRSRWWIENRANRG